MLKKEETLLYPGQPAETMYLEDMFHLTKISMDYLMDFKGNLMDFRNNTYYQLLNMIQEPFQSSQDFLFFGDTEINKKSSKDYSNILDLPDCINYPFFENRHYHPSFED